MAPSKVTIDLSKTAFIKKQVSFSEPSQNKRGHMVSYVNYTDPETGETGTPQFLVKGRFRIVFKPEIFQGKWYLQVDSGVNSMFPDDPSKNTTDKVHLALYHALKDIDDLCTEHAKKSPDVWLCDPSPSPGDFLKKRNSVIHPSSYKPNPNVNVKVPNGKYSDGLKFSLPVSEKDKEHLCKYFICPLGKKFDASNPENHLSINDIQQGQECSMLLESNGVWFPQGKYGHSVKANLIKVYEGKTMSIEAAANALDDEEEEEEEEQETENKSVGIEAFDDDGEEELDDDDDEA